MITPDPFEEQFDAVILTAKQFDEAIGDWVPSKPLWIGGKRD